MQNPVPEASLTKRQRKRRKRMAVWEPNKLPVQDEGNIQIQGSISDKEPVTDLTDDNAPGNPMALKSIEEIDFDDDTNAPDVIKNIPDKAMRRLKYEEYYLTLKEKKLQARLQQALMMKNRANSQTQEASNEQTAVAQTQQNEEEQKEQKEKDEGVHNVSPIEAERKVLEGLPSEIKLVVQEKFKTLATIKKPIIMPSVVEESAATAGVIQSAPVKYDSTQNSGKTTSSAPSASGTKPVVVASTTFKPIEVRFLQNQTKRIDTPPKVPVVPKNKSKNKPVAMKPPLQMKPPGLINTVVRPCGVPRSFLKNQNSYGAIEPQNFSAMTPNQPQAWPHAAPYNATPYQAPFAQHASQTLAPNTAPTYAPQSAGGGQVFAPQTFVPSGAPMSAPIAPQAVQPPAPLSAPVYVETREPVPHQPQQYSPSDAYADSGNANPEAREGSDSPDFLQAGQKRVSAFQRLGPPAHSKKPKLTINLLINSEQAVREVVDEQKNSKKDDKYTPAYLRDDVLTSTDETVMKYLVFWPWKKTYTPWKSATARNSQTLMAVELEQMEEIYEKENLFIQVSVTGYPESWSKEDVLDAILEAVKGKSFIPCFIDFTRDQCKFVVIKCRQALLCLHRIGFELKSNGHRLTVTVSQIGLGLKQLDFIPRLVLRKRLAALHRAPADGDAGPPGGSLDLKEFTLQPDVSHFIYFPLSRSTNQAELVGMQSSVVWAHLTHLDLSRNRLTSIDGFNLPATTPRLRSLDVSHNRLARAARLLASRALPLRSLRLEGNPLCHDYVRPERYVAVLRAIFSTLREIDGVRVRLSGEPPLARRSYCPAEARPLADRLLRVYFPLLEAEPADRALVRPMYHDDALLTVTYRDTLRTAPGYRYYRPLLCEGAVRGAARIAALLAKWPPLEHDPYSFTVDVLYHTDTATIVRVGGLVKLPAETLAEDEHLLRFTRTLALGSGDGAHYAVRHELLHWDAPTSRCADAAFQINRVVTKRINLKFESPPDDDTKENLVNIFMKLTDLDKKSCTRCLEVKEWNFKSALEYFMKLLKLDSLEYLQKVEQN